MKLTATLRTAFAIFGLGMAITYYFSGYEAFLWFGVGSGLALINIFFACWVVAHGLQNVRKKSLFLGLLMSKSATFLAVVAAILVFLKPMLLPFTLGLSVVIFSSIGVALWESRHYFKVHEN